jgi:Ca-activated chloride channel family protein
MIHLAAPFFLLLLLALPWLVFRYRQRQQAAVVHPDVRLFDPQAQRVGWLVRHGGFSLRLAGLALLILALAQPRWPDLRTRLETEGVALLLVLDVSGSMSERDFTLAGHSITRLEAVQRVFRAWVAGGRLEGVQFDGRPGDLVGMVRFAARPEVVCPPTLQHATLLQLLDQQEVDEDPGTNIPDALTLALTRLQAAPAARRVLVLLTDGEDNEPRNRSGWTTTQMANLAQSLGIIIHAIDAGPPEAGEPSALRLLAEQTLEELAALTGGQYLQATDTASLAQACRSIDRLERSPIASFQYRRYHEGYPWLGAAGFALFALAEILTRTWWRRVP